MPQMSDEDLTTRLRAARPTTAEVDPTAYDGALLARLTRAPERRRRRLALPVAGIAAAALAVAVVLAGTHVSSTDDAQAAIARAQRWFDPAPGTILHVRSVLTDFGPQGRRTTLASESWQSVDQPTLRRTVERDGTSGRPVESTPDAVYDPAADTIYENAEPDAAELAQLRRTIERSIAAKIAGAKAAGATPDVIAQLRRDGRRAVADAGLDGGPAAAAPAGDANVAQLRKNFEAGKATAGAETSHDGVDAFPITLTQADSGGRDTVRWTLWTAAADGRPLELLIDSGPGTLPVETTRWTTYEVLPGSRASTTLTLRGAHPAARVVRGRAAYDAATRRLYPHG